MDDPSMFSLVARVSGDLDAQGVVHALTGSVAAGLHGEPVTSMDVDFVVKMTPEVAARLARGWARDLHANEESFRNAAREHGIANLVSFSSGLKVDISMLRDTPYHDELMRRRVRIQPPGTSKTFWVVSPEDIVLMKLVWRRDSRSEKQWRNALSVVRIKGHQLDWAYLRRWAAELCVTEDLDLMMREAGI